MNIWLPITVLAWISSFHSRGSLFVCLFLFSTLTGVSIVSEWEKGIQPLYLIMYGTTYIFMLSYFAKKPKISRIPFTLIILFSFSIFASFISLYSTPFNIGQSIYVLSIPIVALISYLITNKMTYEQIIDRTLKVSIAVFLYGLIDVFVKYFQLPSLENFFVNSKSVVDNTWATAYGVPRATSVFPEPSLLGVFSAVILLFCLSLFISTGKIKIRLLKVTVLLSTINLFLTASLAGYLVFAAGVIYVIIITILSGSFFRIAIFLKSIILFILFALFLFLILSLLFPSFIDELNQWTLMRFQFSDDSTLLRTGTLKDGYDLMESYPLTGVGLGNFTSPDLISTVAATSGLIGFIMLSSYFIFPIFKGLLYSTSKKLDHRNLPFFMMFFSIFIAFSTGLGHFIILWPWVLLGTSVKFIHANTKFSQRGRAKECRLFQVSAINVPRGRVIKE